MAKFSKFEKTVILGGIAVASVFSCKAYSHLDGCYWSNYPRENREYTNADKIQEQVNYHNRWKWFDAGIVFAGLIAPISYAQIRKEFRGIKEDEAKEGERGNKK